MLVKGEKLEKDYSLFAHQNYCALLISSDYLRKNHMGQIDVAHLYDGKAYVAECKSGREEIDPLQLLRLKHACVHISLLLNVKAALFLVTRFAKSDNSAYPFKIKKIGELA